MKKLFFGSPFFFPETPGIYIRNLFLQHRLRQRAIDELRTLKIVDSEDSTTNQELSDCFLIPAGMISRLAISDEANNENILEKKDVYKKDYNY